MGHRKKHAPRRGTLGVRRKKSKRDSARWRSWPSGEKPTEARLRGFGGYKAGMTHVALIEGRKYSPMYKQEKITPVTVIETPPIKVFGIRLYGMSRKGMMVLGETWEEELEEILSKKILIPQESTQMSSPEELRSLLPQTMEVRVLALTQPGIAGLPRKKPDILEIKVDSPSLEDSFDYALSKLGSFMRMSDMYQEGDMVDVTAVTKGKGFQGPVKRFGIKILPRKTNKGRRAVGCIGPWTPARVMWTVPRAGQMGYHARTEYNKQILKIGDDPEEVNPSSGFKRYGVLKGDHIIVKGSVPGPAKRLIRLRDPMRDIRMEMEPPRLSYISTSGKN